MSTNDNVYTDVQDVEDLLLRLLNDENHGGEEGAVARALEEELGLTTEQARRVRANSYEEVGMLTMDSGVQLSLPGGLQFAITITSRGRRAL